ncbi:hypothetical protein ACFL6U_14675 [Planctomycetota bacterium]
MNGDATVTTALAPFDWAIVVLFIGGSIAVGLLYTKKASKDISSFFVSGRVLPWYICGMAWVASGFASDTPLWVSALVRSQGIHYAWKYWGPIIGMTLAAVLFARLWRRLGVVTDVELLENRYSSPIAGFLRLWEGSFKALVYCPLVIAWVVKAMEVISREAMGLPEEYQAWTTVIVVGLGLIMCTMSGLMGVVATGSLQFALATGGTILLAVMSVRHVGGLDALVTHLQSLEGWPGRDLTFLPRPGNSGGLGQMPLWNIIGMFGILWWSNAYCGDYAAQRVLACKDSRHASLGVWFFAILYYPIMAWPWLIVGLCSLKAFPLEMIDKAAVDPNIHKIVSFVGDNVLVDSIRDSAYPKMMVEVLPIGLKGVLVAAMIAAFISTVTTLFNWGSSYVVNDIYRRFLVKKALDKHYVFVSRISTVAMAALGGYISYKAMSIEQILMISWVILPASTIVGLLRWLWWRQNAAGDLAGTITAWSMGTGLALLSFEKVAWTATPRAAIDAIAAKALGLIGLSTEASFITSDELLGARMLLLSFMVAFMAVVVSLLGKPTDMQHLKTFVLKAKPPKYLWRRVLQETGCDYETESLGRTLVSWILACVSVMSLVFAIGKLLLGEPLVGLVNLGIFVVSTIWVVKRMNDDFKHECSEPQ